jgi:Ca2+-binding EF-hand superfamily protein
MKITSILFALLATASFSFAAEGDAKKPAEGDKPKKPYDAAAAFAKKDANGDGKLSKEEFTKGAKDAAKAETQFTARDKDKDGSVSKEEFTAAPKKKDKDAK